MFLLYSLKGKFNISSNSAFTYSVNGFPFIISASCPEMGEAGTQAAQRTRWW